MSQRREPSSFGRQLIWLRRQKRLSQEKLAEQAGLSLAIISSLEQGLRQDPRLSTMVKLARALGVTLDQLVGEAAAAAG
jgi:transcriptional regulator with XRE-family HTH domain